MSATTVAEYLDEWMLVRRSRLQPYTIRSYEQAIRAYLKPQLGHLRLDDLDVRTLDRTYAELLRRGGLYGKPLAPRTVRYAASILRAALEHAVRTGEIDRNVARYATTPKFDHTGEDPSTDELRAWTAAEARRFLELVRGDHFEELFVLALGTGMRRGELLGLRWEDVDMAERTVHVRRALSVVRRHGKLKTTKNARSRALRVDDRVLAALNTRLVEQRRERGNCNGEWRDEWGLVFTCADGSFIHPDRVSSHWRRLIRTLDVPTIRLHDLRHTHATLMLQAGVPIKIVSERLGHSGIELTIDTYMHVLPAMDADAVERFAQLIDGEDSDAVRFGSLDGWQWMGVYLPDVLRAGLERLAAERGVAVGDLIRESAARLVDRE